MNERDNDKSLFVDINNNKFDLFKIEFEQLIKQTDTLRSISFNSYKQGIYLMFILNGYTIIEILKLKNGLVYYSSSIQLFGISILIAIIVCFLSSIVYDYVIESAHKEFYYFNVFNINNNLDKCNKFKINQKKYLKILKLLLITIPLMVSVVFYVLGYYKLLLITEKL